MYPYLAVCPLPGCLFLSPTAWQVHIISRYEILRDIEADITDGAHNEEDPDADIDELDFFSDED